MINAEMLREVTSPSVQGALQGLCMFQVANPRHVGVVLGIFAYTESLS